MVPVPLPWSSPSPQNPSTPWPLHPTSPNAWPPAKTPQEAATDAVWDLLGMGYRPLAGVADGQGVRATFAQTMRHQGPAFVGPLGGRTRVAWEGQTYRAKDLLGAYPPGKAGHYWALGVYARRRSGVFWSTVGVVDLVLVWRAWGEAWEGLVLVSTLEGGVQGVRRVWFARWEREVAHRTYKRGLGLGGCWVRTGGALGDGGRGLSPGAGGDGDESGAAFSEGQGGGVWAA